MTRTQNQVRLFGREVAARLVFCQSKTIKKRQETARRRFGGATGEFGALDG